MSTSDQQLLESITARDAAAFAEFYQRHAARVFALLVRLLGDRADAEDVLQETFWQVWRSAERYDALAPVRRRGWSRSPARERSIGCGAARLRRKSPSIPRRPPATILARCSTRQETDEHLRAALELLPEEQRSAILRAFFDGWTHLEIAERQGIPLGTAKTRIALGMKRLRGLLRPAPSEHVP